MVKRHQPPTSRRKSARPNAVLAPGEPVQLRDVQLPGAEERAQRDDAVGRIHRRLYRPGARARGRIRILQRRQRRRFRHVCQVRLSQQVLFWVRNQLGGARIAEFIQLAITWLGSEH